MVKWPVNLHKTEMQVRDTIGHDIIYYAIRRSALLFTDLRNVFTTGNSLLDYMENVMQTLYALLIAVYGERHKNLPIY